MTECERSPDYQRLAEACLDMAERAKGEQKGILLQMAEVWLGLAAEQLNEESAGAKKRAIR